MVSYPVPTVVCMDRTSTSVLFVTSPFFFYFAASFFVLNFFIRYFFFHSRLKEEVGNKKK